MKVNWDGAKDVAGQKTDFGGIVRDSVGEVLAFICSSLSYPSKPDVAKALALWRVMIICEEIGLTQLHFGRDCHTIIRAVGGVGVGSKDVMPIIYDIQYLLQNHPVWSIGFAPRKCNHVVHALAKLALCLLT